MSKRPTRERTQHHDEDGDTYDSIIPMMKRDRKKGKRKTKIVKEDHNWGFSSEPQPQVASTSQASVSLNAVRRNDQMDHQPENDGITEEELKEVDRANRFSERMRKKMVLASNWGSTIFQLSTRFTDVFAEPGPAVEATKPHYADIKCNCENPQATSVVTCVFLSSTLIVYKPFEKGSKN